jgi:hypothetical protein
MSPKFSMRWYYNRPVKTAIWKVSRTLWGVRTFFSNEVSGMCVPEDENLSTRVSVHAAGASAGLMRDFVTQESFGYH